MQVVDADQFTDSTDEDYDENPQIVALEKWLRDLGEARVVASRAAPGELRGLSNRLDKVGSSIFQGKASAKNVRWSLVAHLVKRRGRDESDAESITSETQEAYTANLTSEIEWFSVPKLKHIPATESSLRLRRVHYAIEIPSEPAERIVKTDIEAVEFTAENEAGVNSVGGTRNELPERILFNSLRLRRFIDYEYCNGGQPWSASGPFTILRPYKGFVYLQDKIRSRISDFERAREALLIATEDEYTENYKNSPLEDTAAMGHQRESTMSLGQLTGWILDFRCLQKFLDEYLEPHRIRLANCPDSVLFSDLWFLFPVGCLVYVRDHHLPQKVWKVIQRTGGRRYAVRPESIPHGDYKNTFTDFVIDCFHLDYNGTQYVPTFSQFRISSFYGLQPTGMLPVMPLKAAEREKLVDRAELLERAQVFKECTRVCHRHYSGRSMDRAPSGQRLCDLDNGSIKNVSMYSERIDSEVMVDFERALQELPTWRPGGDDFETFEMDRHERGDSVDRDEEWDKRFTQDFLEGEIPRSWKQWDKDGSEPTLEDDLLLLPDRVFAFVLRSRNWACLQLGKGPTGKEQLTRLQPRPEPWNNLELPEGHKEIVQSLVTSHFSNNKDRQVHFDLVQDKGKGVIILLHGVPGVGKSSTAECVAESYARPLLPITCGDLGLSPSEVEEKLQQIFRLAQAWNCVMLLDEADIFLAQRTATDTERNALVSVFLRVLEYYEGILFLTTNRVGVFDEAFKSRIHMSLYYPPLTLEQTLKIWNTHITRATQSPQIEADAMSLITCANEIFHRQLDPKFGPVWNGRQIRNAFQSAVSLAGFHTAEGEPINLQRKYFEHVFRVSDHFSNYVWSVNQRHSDAQLNMMRMVRSDDWAAPAGEGSMHTNPASFPYQQRGHQPMAEQTRLSAFPQSTYGQTIPRALTPIGGAPLSQQLIPQHPLPNHMLGTQQMGQPPWNTATQAQPQAQAQVQAQAQMQAQMQAQVQVPASQSQTAPFGSAAAGSGGAWNEAGAGAGEGLQQGQGQLFQPNSAVRPPAAQYTHQDMLPSLSTGMGPGPGPLLGLGQRAAQKPPGLG